MGAPPTSSARSSVLGGGGGGGGRASQGAVMTGSKPKVPPGSGPSLYFYFEHPTRYPDPDASPDPYPDPASY